MKVTVEGVLVLDGRRLRLCRHCGETISDVDPPHPGDPWVHAMCP